MKKLFKNLFNRTWYDDVKDFHKGSEQRIGTTPEFPGEAERKLRMTLLEEEFKEYIDAEVNDDLVEVADALADMIYIICGTAVSYGIPLNEVFDEVHKSNMAKFINGKAIRRAGGKILKPLDWRPPNIEQFIKN